MREFQMASKTGIINNNDCIKIKLRIKSCKSQINTKNTNRSIQCSMEREIMLGQMIGIGISPHQILSANSLNVFK
jgi:hypothetical protein